MTTSTYEELREKARQTSITCGYGAVVEIHTYLSSSGPRMTVAGGRSPIKSQSRRGEFVGLVAQWKDGQPYGDGRPMAVPQPVPVMADDDDTLPF